MRKTLDSRHQTLEWGREEGYQHSLGRSVWRSSGKELGQLGKRGILGVVHNIWELSTKLSTAFSTPLAENYPKIHRLYYYYYFI